jgi:membrane fusion protein, multidrug efflux system
MEAGRVRLRPETSIRSDTPVGTGPAGRSWRPFAWIGLGLLGLGAGIAFLVLGGNDEEDVRGTPVLVRTVEAVSRASTLVVSGEAEAHHSVDVSFQTPGVVQGVGPEEGDAVPVGALLAWLDPEPFEHEAERAAADESRTADALDRARELLAVEGVPPAEFIQLEAAHRAAAAQAGLARRRLQDTRLLSPLPGRVARRNVEVGEFASPGAPVFTIVSTETGRIRVGVPEGTVRQVRSGQRAEVRVQALGDEALEGTVAQVGVAADSHSRTYRVRIDLTDPPPGLRAGMIAEATIFQGETRAALTVPGEAVVRTPDGLLVLYVLDEAGERAIARRIQVGSVLGREVEIVSGIVEGDRVVVGGQHRIFDGARVEAAPERGAPP